MLANRRSGFGHKDVVSNSGWQMTDRIVRLPECIKLSGLGKTSIYKKMAAGTFPSKRKLTAYAVGWRLSEIEAWLQPND